MGCGRSGASAGTMLVVVREPVSDPSKDLAKIVDPQAMIVSTMFRGIRGFQTYGEHLAGHRVKLRHDNSEKRTRPELASPGW